MLPDFEPKLRTFADLMVRVGLNLQRGQRLLVAEPYELQGVARSAEVIVEAVRHAAMRAAGLGPAAIDVIWGDGPRLREFAVTDDWRGYHRLTAANAALMQRAVDRGDALLFLQGSQPRLMEGVDAGRVAELHRIGWEQFGPVAQRLVGGATNWTVAPAPSPAWANHVYADRPSDLRLAALWSVVFEAVRIGLPGNGAAPPPAAADALTDAALHSWQQHRRALQDCRDGLNAQRLKSLRYVGPRTDLRISLPAEHRWATALLTTKDGRPFVANLPTEEVFTLPHRAQVDGTVSVARPISHGGAIISGITLVFRAGRVVQATADTNDPLLQQLLSSDDGSDRLGEVALVLRETSLARAGRLFHHPLLDENASNHIALGEAYPFCLHAPDPAAMNRSLVHVDLPLDARVMLGQAEPA